MGFEVKHYLIVKKTGLFTPDGEECVIVYHSTLNREAADTFCAKNPGTSVVKMTANRDTLQVPAKHQKDVRHG